MLGLKFRDFIEKRQLCTLKKIGGHFLAKKNAPAGILPVAPNLQKSQNINIVCIIYICYILFMHVYILSYIIYI